MGQDFGSAPSPLRQPRPKRKRLTALQHWCGAEAPHGAAQFLNSRPFSAFDYDRRIAPRKAAATAFGPETFPNNARFNAREKLSGRTIALRAPSRSKTPVRKER